MTSGQVAENLRRVFKDEAWVTAPFEKQVVVLTEVALLAAVEQVISQIEATTGVEIIVRQAMRESWPTPSKARAEAIKEKRYA